MSDYRHGNAGGDGKTSGNSQELKPIPAECTSHINYLSPEVLTRIFVFVIFHQPTFPSPLQSLAGYSVISQTLTLATVCRLWQNLTFSVPQFWTEIVVYIPPNIPIQIGEQKAAYINDWLERSGGLPLSLFIHYRCILVHDPLPAPWDDPVRPVWEVIERHADRFETIHYDDARSWKLPRKVQTVSSLTNFLSVTSPSWNGLRHLYCCDFSAPFRFIKAVPWTQLTHLNIRAVRFPGLLFSILEHCPNLIELQFSTERSSYDSVSPVIRNNLRKLTAHLADFDRLFSALALPSLEELRLFLNYDVRASADQFAAFLRRSGCKLNTLKMTDFVFSSNGLSSVLEQESCQSLTGLAIDFCWNLAETKPFESSLIQRLTIGPLNPSPWCPDLLFLRLGPVQAGSLDTLVDMVESRLCRTRETRIRYMVLKIVSKTGYEEHLTDVAKRNGVTSVCAKIPGYLIFKAYTTTHPL